MTLRSKLIICLTFLCLSSIGVASKRLDLYRLGNTAYKEGNYVTALKNLYAYYVLNEERLPGNPVFKQKLEAAIKRCEDSLNWSHGSVLRLLVDASSGGGVPGFRAQGQVVDEGINTKLDEIIRSLNPSAPSDPTAGSRAGRPPATSD